MLCRFAPNEMLLEEFKAISFNHVLLYKRNTKCTKLFLTIN